MSDIPGIFGDSQAAVATKTNPKSTKGATYIQEGATKQRRDTQKKQRTEDILVETNVAKDPPLAAATQPTSSRVFKEVGKIGDSSISETEYKKWKAKTHDQKLAIATRASLELLLFNTEQSQEKKNTTSHIKELEEAVAKLKLDVNNANVKATTLEASNSSLQKDLAQQKELAKEKDKSITELEEKITELQLDIAELETAKDIAKNDGIRTYCQNFLVGDPNYDWRAQFGKHMAAFMADLAKKEIEFVTTKRAELEKMVANEVEELALQQEELAR